jgi:hypothetical protein
MRKGQVEFVVILGVVFLFVIVVFYAYQNGLIGRPTLPEDVAKIQDNVEVRIESVIAAGAKLLLLDMETHGGYLTDPVFIRGSDTTIPDYVLFVGEGVPYWQKCQNDLSLSREEIKSIFEFALKNYILNHSGEFLDLFGKNVTFDVSRLDVDANILRDKIVLTVTLPTTVQGYDIREPYTREVSTKFGEIIDFAIDTAKEFSVNRNLEYFTIYSIYFSKNLEDGHPKLPTIGFLTDCGETLQRSPAQIEEYLLESATYVVTNTHWWQGFSTNPSRSKTFGIEDVDGKRYMDLSMNMYLPDDFGFNVGGSSISIKNNDLLASMVIFIVPECMSAYNQVYRVSYPVIISVDDPLTGNSFNFGSFVHVTDAGEKMTPGDCEAAGEVIEDPCREASCSARIRSVWHKDSDGSTEPLEGSVVTFGECYLGMTDSDGYVEGNVKCGTHDLTIFNSGDFSFYDKAVSSSSLSGTYELRYKPRMDAHYRRVGVESRYGSDPCSDSGQNYRCSVGGFGDNEIVIGSMDSGSESYPIVSRAKGTDCLDSPECQGCVSTNDVSQCSACSDLCSSGGFENDVRIEYIPSGDYSVEVSVRDADNAYETGKIDLYYTLLENAEDLYINVPSVWEAVYEISDYDGECLEDIVANKCGIDLVTDKDQPTHAYYYSCDSNGLGDVAGDLQAKGCRADLDSVLNNVEAFRSRIGGCDAKLVCA